MQSSVLLGKQISLLLLLCSISLQHFSCMFHPYSLCECVQWSRVRHHHAVPARGGMTVSSPWVCLLAPGAGNTILNGRQLKSPRQERRGHFTPHLFFSKRSGKLSQLASTGIKIQIYATSNHLALSPCKPFVSANWKGGEWEIRMTSFQDWKEGKTDIVKPAANLVGRNCDRLDHADDTKLIIPPNSATVQHQQKGDKS